MPNLRSWSFEEVLLAFVVFVTLVSALAVSLVYIRLHRFNSDGSRSMLLITVSRVLSAGGVVWCITMAWWISGNMSGVPLAPLMLPALLAAFGTWAVWRHRTIAVFVTAGVFLVFSILTGFSIGRGYLPAAAAFLWSGLVSLENQD